ncbi:hypothetical protein JQ620_24475 [Bradyrhizobium sp. AUGA SZCCT0274]|uniref:hypothetical protein n=1 Tax=Bradyrhizobium sp. AUGA SZCCT0274 TaxID=2807670 RepID=UPI001BADD46B|nr:hypothetical protein [Bradyrhizobium sp. AUGA SZCCT0274]MBR1243262.1 hypothetical protein [Bradyrhizobium sp. AUGA SZCCT0274]
MAKNSDHRAGGLGTDDTGGVLSGLLAEEEDLDRRALWRLGSWGVGAVAAVVVAVMANQTQFGWKRDQMAATDLNQRAQQIQNIASQTEREARRLAAAIDTLNSDRDRLYSRVTGLERGLDSVTGSIARQNSAAASPAPAAPSPAEPQASQAAQIPAPTVAPVTTQTAAAAPDKSGSNPIPAEPGPAAVSSVAKDSAKEPGKETAKETIKPELPKIEAKKTDPIRPEAAKPELAKAEAVKPETGKPEGIKSDTAKIDTVRIEAAKADAATPATPLVASQSFMAPPDPSATKLIEPARPLSPVTASPIPEVMAAAPATDAEADEETGPRVPVQRTQFGVDLGTANSVPGLRALWRGLLKSRSNAPLAALRPIIVVKESTNGLGMQLRLVAGPINDAGAAARICAVLTENKRNCETAIFDGQRLSLTGDNPALAPSAKPAPRRRGAVTKRATVGAVEEPAKKPETAATTSVSSWFGKRGQ